MLRANDIRKKFIELYKNKEFVTDKTGAETIEIIGASFIADLPSIFGIPSKKYIEQELAWYDSMSTNIYDISPHDEPPKAWKYSANEHGEINSNYGYLIYHSKFYNQYENALNELIENPNSRRATMIYNRPSIWVEYNDQGKSDFICTNAVSYYIRNGRLDAVVQMRSNDVVFGYKNDYAWQREVQHRMAADYTERTWTRYFDATPVVVGDLYWQVQNLHVYDRHFKFIEAMI